MSAARLLLACCLILWLGGHNLRVLSQEEDAFAGKQEIRHHHELSIDTDR